MCPQHHSPWPSAKWRKCRDFWNCQRNWFPCQVSSCTVGGPNSTFVLAAMQIKGCWQGAEGFVPGLLQPFLSPAWGMLLAFGFLELSYRSSFVGHRRRAWEIILRDITQREHSWIARGRSEKREDKGRHWQSHPLPQKMQAYWKSRIKGKGPDAPRSASEEKGWDVSPLWRLENLPHRSRDLPQTRASLSIN